ncbi:MAG: PAS domain-containing protein [Chthoniobacter sp.]|nr:PAS domain-containing protein [Chthoniobacter sp.]
MDRIDYIGDEASELTGVSRSLEERTLLQFVLEHGTDRIFFKDRESRFIRISRSLAKRFGLQDEEEIVGKTDFDFFSPSHAQAAFDDEKKIMQTGEPIFGKIEKETLPDGRIRYAITTKMPLRNENGNTVGTCGISTDLTKQVDEEEMLAKTYTLLGGAQVEKIFATSKQLGRWSIQRMRSFGKTGSRTSLRATIEIPGSAVFTGAFVPHSSIRSATSKQWESGLWGVGVRRQGGVLQKRPTRLAWRVARGACERRFPRGWRRGFRACSWER